MDSGEKLVMLWKTRQGAGLSGDENVFELSDVGAGGLGVSIFVFSF